MRSVTPFDARAYYYYYGGGALARRASGSLGGAFSPLSLSPHGLWLPFQANLAEDEDGSGSVTATEAVGRVTDTSGNGRHLLQATAGARPTYQVDGEAEFLLGDGSDDYMLAVFGADLVQPYSRMSAFRVLTNDTRTLLGGGDGTNNVNLSWYNDALNLISYAAGSEVFVSRPPPALNQDFVVYEEYSGASSALWIDGVQVDTDDAGASALKGLSVLASGASSSPINARWYGTVVLPRLATADERANLFGFFSTLLP